LRVNGRRRYTVPFQKRHRFGLLFLYMNSEWNDGVQNGTMKIHSAVSSWRVLYKTPPFHLNKNGAKKCLFPNQSSVFNLFNQVLNCKFDFKNRFNCILVKSNVSPEVGRLFHFYP
jgi:hypothetical protein